MDKHMEREKGWNALREGLFQGQGAGWNRLRTGLLTAIAVMLVMTATMGSAWAYFTTYARAKGSFVIHMGHEEHVDEDFNSWEKVINITSTADSRPVYIRAKAFCVNKYNVSYSNSQNWTRVGDWMYYNKLLAPGTSLSDAGDQLKAKINDVPKSSDPSLRDGETFNVIVVYETIEVQYDENGDPVSAVDADWNAKVDTSRTSTTLGGEE